MKIGVMSHGSPDYLVDIVSDGVIRKHGRSNVSLDYQNVDTSGGWCGQYKMMMQGFGGPEPFPINDADVLIASTRSIRGVEKWMKKTGKKNVALLDGEDGCDLLEPWPSMVKAYFKREYISDRKYHKNVMPLPFGIIPESVPQYAEVKRDVFFRAHGNSPERFEIARKLTSMGHHVHTERIEKGEYNKYLMESLVGISVRGGGWDTYRYWEVAYFGAALLSQRLPITIPKNFIEDVEAVFFKDESEMAVKLTGMVADKARTLELAARGRKACLDRHMSTNRALTVLEALG